MKSLRFLMLLVAAAALAPQVLAADFGVRAGRYNDAEEEFVGAEMVFDLGAININPNIEYMLGDEDVTAGSANFDVLFEFAPSSRVSPYVGAGVGLMYFDTDVIGTETDLVGNVIGGLSFNMDFLKPYAQVKYFKELEDDEDGGDDLALTIGLRF